MWYQIEFECSQQIWLVHSVVLLKSNKNQKKRNETASSGLFDASAEKYKNLRAVQIAEKEWIVCWKYRARFPASPPQLSQFYPRLVVISSFVVAVVVAVLYS